MSVFYAVLIVYNSFSLVFIGFFFDNCSKETTYGAFRRFSDDFSEEKTTKSNGSPVKSKRKSVENELNK